MISKESYIQLERERRELRRMIHKALGKGISIAEDEEILRQSRKMDALTEELLCLNDRDGRVE